MRGGLRLTSWNPKPSAKKKKTAYYLVTAVQMLSFV
jgi:hypothetical protein